MARHFQPKRPVSEQSSFRLTLWIAPYLNEGLPLLDGLKSKPAMLAVGMKDRAIAPENQISDFKAIWPEGPIIKLPNAGHFSQEDAPETIIALIELFILSTR